jgi:Divergent InlB B-repeat domain/Fibronectin type III domain
MSVAQAFAANPSPCAGYFVSVPPLAADKTQIRSGVAPEIRALGPSFHALAEVNVTAWQGWVASTGSSWYQAGVEARTRMEAAGFDVSAGDSWAVNELSSAVRTGTGPSRQNIRDLVHGLYDGDGTEPAARGVVFVSGIGQPTASLGTYKANLESWLQDAAFWGDMSAYVSDFLQESYGDVRDYGVAGADVPTRLGYLNAYLEHVLQLASVSPSTASAAASYLRGGYAPLANAAWAWSSGFGFTAVPYDQMEDYVSAQVDAMRSYEAGLGLTSDRVGFAWDPSNTLGLSSSDFASETGSLLARLAAAIAASGDPTAPGAGACQSPWCTANVDGAAFTPSWSAFSSWTPTGPAFGSAPVTVTAGSATGPMSVETQVGGIVTALPIDTTVGLSSSSPGGSFSTSPTGPWTPTLALAVPAGATSATFYMRDTQTGNPTVNATIGTQAAAQIEIVTEPAAPLALAGADNTVTYAEGGPPVTVDPSLTLSDEQSATLDSATVALAAGARSGDALTATTAGTAITASYSDGTLTLSGSDSLADYQAVLRSVSFTGTDTAAGTRTVIWTASDGISSASAESQISYTTAPGAPVGAAAQAADGQAAITFDAPAQDGGTSISSYTVTSSPGGLSASGTSSPISVTGLANGTSYTFTVTATNAAGTGPSSTPSNAVTPIAVGGGGGGGSSGGGGSGGGGSPPNLAGTLSGPSGATVGSSVSLTMNIANTGGVAFDTTLILTTNGLGNLSAQAIWGLGAGCSVSGTTVSCDLASLPTGGAIPVAVISATVASLPASATASMTTTPADSDPADNSATWSLQEAPPSPPLVSPAPATTPVTKHPTKPRMARRANLTIALEPGHVAGSVRIKRLRSTRALELGSSVTLTAAARRGWRFGYWAANCSGKRFSKSSTCIVTMNKTKTVTAVFVRARHPKK